MSASIISHTTNKLTIQIDFTLEGSMIQMEEHIQDVLNEAGQLATGKALEQCDTNGLPLTLAQTRLTARKEKMNQRYETPYGKVDVKRYLYQSSGGGKTYCPMEENARCIRNSTPRFAKIVSEKYARMGAHAVCADIESTQRRSIAQAYVQNLAEDVGTIAQLQEEDWEYEIPEPPRPVKQIGISIDATCKLLTRSGLCETMTGTISLYDSRGERIHTIYIAATSEYGKEKFKTKMKREIERIIARYPNATVTGLGDGAQDNWNFLENYCDRLMVDFWHASEQVHQVADSRWGDAAHHRETKEAWLDEQLHKLKHEDGYIQQLLSEFRDLQRGCKTSTRKDQVVSAIRYFMRHEERMPYAEHVRQQYPIESGATEAAWKTVVQQRLDMPGARWTEKGMGIVLSLRTLVLTPGYWNSFWEKMMQDE